MYSPFWDFFDTINHEVDQFNRLLFSNGFENRIRKTPRASKAITANNDKNDKNDENDKNSKQVAERPRRSKNSLAFPNLMFPSFFNSSFFNDDFFDVVPPIDVLDNDSNYELHVSIPGVPKDKIKLDFNADNNEFKISGEVPGHLSESPKLKVKERSCGYFERRIRLPNTTKLDGENIKATHNNGVLVLTIPKLEKTKSNTRRIMISSSDAGYSTKRIEENPE